jgi:hypothetical protein
VHTPEKSLSKVRQVLERRTGPAKHERERVVIPFGKVTRTVAERKLREHIQTTQVNSVETFNEITSPATTFREQAKWWLQEIRVGRIVSRKRRTQIKPATITSYETAVNRLNERLGNLQLADIKNDVTAGTVDVHLASCRPAITQDCVPKRLGAGSISRPQMKAGEKQSGERCETKREHSSALCHQPDENCFSQSETSRLLVLRERRANRK